MKTSICLSQSTWHLLQASDVLDLEFASALAESVSTIAWRPKRHWMPVASTAFPEGETPHPGSRLRIREFPVARGYARFPVSLLAAPGNGFAVEMARISGDPAMSPLICSVPFFAGVAEHWPGPVIYWLTDLICEYKSARRINVRGLDRRMCNIATLVCPNSERIAMYLINEAGCDPRKIHVVPNAARAVNVFTSAPRAPAPLPDRLANMQRPVAGVIGNLAANMDWVLLRKVIHQTTGISWAFIGPTSMHIEDSVQREAREQVMAHERTRFVGRRPYSELVDYARAFDVAVMPYLKREPTFSGSGTRFYEHLLACRPMLATSGLAELSEKRRFLQIVDSPEEMSAALLHLRSINFRDGLEHLRWKESSKATWTTRALSMRAALEDQLRNRHLYSIR